MGNQGILRAGRSRPEVQAKLKIGRSNDVYEQEADHVADQIMGMHDIHNRESRVRNVLQKKAAAGDQTITAPSQFGDGVRALTGGGERLPDSERNFFEQRFGYDFGSVRIHAGESANRSAQSIDARAYTHGRNIVFNKGAYQPNTQGGRRLLAHELTHVLQQQQDVQTVRRQSRRRIDRVTRPKLSLYQIDDDARAHFHAQAYRKAREIGAIQLDVSNECPRYSRIGPSPYRSGAEIIELIAKAYWCTGRPLKELHIFSHGFSGGGGVVAAPVERRGLVAAHVPLTAGQRELGARRVGDIQDEPFADDAIVVLHGCEIGHGDNSFAEQMLRHLVGTRPDVRIFAHSRSGECGRTDDWREFDRDMPDGRRIRINPFHRPDVVRRTPLDEEQRLQNPVAGAFIAGSTLSAYIQQLTDALAVVPGLVGAQAVVNWWGYKLWEHARVIAQQQGDTDDRPLYWTRLQMRQVIRQFNPGSRFTLSAVQRNQLIEGFEASSRGMPTGGAELRWIDNVKRILISGFDPFQLDRNISQGNPSGAVALALDGKVIRHPRRRGLMGQIQGVVLPVRFGYFDQGHVEHFFRPYIQGANPVDMVMTISQGGNDFEFEEYGSRFREPALDDNERELGGTPVLPPGAEFTRSTLPRAGMRREVLGRTGPLAEESEFSGIDAGGRSVSGPSRAHPDPSRLVRATGGSGGTYLSNEVFYRTTLLRDVAADPDRRDLPVGHLHIPVVEDMAGRQGISTTEARNSIINTVERLIIAALPDL